MPYLAVLYFILKLVSGEFEMSLLRSLGVENKLFSVLILCSVCMYLTGMLELFRVKRLISIINNAFPRLVMLLQGHNVEDGKTCQVDEQLEVTSACKEAYGKILLKREVLAVLLVYAKGICGGGIV